MTLRRTLGRTGLRVPAVALGTGGVERIGQARGAAPAAIEEYIREAVTFGVDYIDTAPGYDDSEQLIGAALRDVPVDVTVATKFRPYDSSGLVRPVEALQASLERSLARLGRSRVDLLQLHGVEPAHYREVTDRFVPELLRLQEENLIGHFGITEKPTVDPEHRMLRAALADQVYATTMVGLGVLNRSAVSLAATAARDGVGIIAMISAQGLGSWADRIRRAATDDAGLHDRLAAVGDPADPIAWLIGDSELTSAELAYRYAAGIPGVSTVLSGTSSFTHLRANVAAVAQGNLPQEVLERIDALLADTIIP